MRNPLPVQEIRETLDNKGFLRLHGQERFLYISDVPRRVSGDVFSHIQMSLRKQGFLTSVDPSALLLIDLTPERWETLLDTFQTAEAVCLPQNETRHDVYALARLLARHPADFAEQPMELIRAVCKLYCQKDGLPALAPQLLERCAEKLRRGEPLPSALAKVLYTWLDEF